MKSRAPLLLLAIAGTGIAAGRAAPPPDEPDRSSIARPTPDRITGPLEALLAGRRGTDSVRIRVDWTRGDGTISAELFGRGVGIWNDRVQFPLSRRDLLAALAEFRNARFGAMPDQFGEVTDFLRMRGKSSLTIAGAEKTVVQLEAGPQSEKLRDFTGKVLGMAERRARRGVSAASLADGLGKIAAGRLAPEALDVVVVRREEKPANPAEEEGSLLAVRGRDVRARVFRRATGYGTPSRLTLSDEEVKRLTSLLAEESLADLPSNLYAREYTDLHVAVLQWKKDLQARTYLDVTPQTHGAKQAAFDRIDRELRLLLERVVREGREEPQAAGVTGR
jgi:hypothetical protein